MNRLFSPFGLLLFGTEISENFWRDWLGNWLKEMDTYRYKQEAGLQRDLLGTSESDAPERVLLRINCVAAAIRMFLKQHQPLTMASRAFPVVRAAEMELARHLAHSFKVTEHNVRHRLPVHVTLEEWRKPESYRDELSQMACNDHEVYQMVASMDTLPQQQRQQVAHELADRLQAEHAAHHPLQQQMS